MEKGKFYCLEYTTIQRYYFCFDKIDNNNLYLYGDYSILCYKNKFSYYTTYYFTNWDILSKYVIKEVDLSVIVNHLPNDNKDKIIYLRKQRIKNLLYESC